METNLYDDHKVNIKPKLVLSKVKSITGYFNF